MASCFTIKNILFISTVLQIFSLKYVLCNFIFRIVLFTRNYIGKALIFNITFSLLTHFALYNLFTVINFLCTHITRKSSVKTLIHTIWIRGTPLLCGFLGASFHAPRNCSFPQAIAYLRQYFQVDTTWVLSKNASISTSKAHL